MFSKSLLILGLLAGVAFVGAGFLSSDQPKNAEIQEKELMLVLRGVGHGVLLQAGDSISRVLPVKKVGSGVFELEFESRFKFVPDTLVKLVHTSLASGNLPLQYMVNVMDCSTNLIIYGYRIGTEQTTLVPCRGRVQPVGCYRIQITFLDNPVKTGDTKLFVGLGLMAIALVGLIAAGRTKPKPLDSRVEDGSFIPLGSYSFSGDRRVLRNGSNSVSLTDKESRLLALLAAHQNIPLDRDQLMKEVWEDDGVFVGRSLDVFISKLRKKLQGDPTLQIVNIHGKGYKLQVG